MDRFERYFKRLKSQVVPGRRGVVHAREVLKKAREEYGRYKDMFTDRADNAAAYHSKQAVKQLKREEIAAFLSSDTQILMRGDYGELLLTAEAKRWYWTLRNHPVFATWTSAQKVVETATTNGLLPKQYQDWDDKGRGNGVSVDIYGYKAGLVLVQIRRVERRTKNGYLNVHKRYVVTDGTEIMEVSAQAVRRSIKADDGVATPLHAVVKTLPAGWQKLVGEQFKIPPLPQVQREVWKVLAMVDGTLRSVYDNSLYDVGKWRTEKARSDHRGGFYAYASAAEAIEAAKANEIFRREWTEGKQLVLARCEAMGTPIRYGNKLAFSRIRVLEICEGVTL